MLEKEENNLLDLVIEGLRIEKWYELKKQWYINWEELRVGYGFEFNQ